PEADGGALRAGHLFGEDAHSAREDGSPHEGSPGCVDAEFRDIERELHRAVHCVEPTPFGSGVRARLPPDWGQANLATDKSVCPPFCGSLGAEIERTRPIGPSQPGTREARAALAAADGIETRLDPAVTAARRSPLGPDPLGRRRPGCRSTS